MLLVSGLKTFILTPRTCVISVGERNNVTGSANFGKLIAGRYYAAAVKCGA